MKILIDNGHGRDTPGKCSPDGRLREYAYAREIAQMVVDALRSKGYDAQCIVTEENDVSLKERCHRVNTICKEHGAANVLLVSVHNNAAGIGNKWMNARGWSAYTTKGNTLSDKIAECLYCEAEKILIGHKIRKDMQDGDRDWEENFYILKHTACPAVLTENLFQDNEEDVAFLMSDKGKAAITALHVNGIIDYLS